MVNCSPSSKPGETGKKIVQCTIHTLLAHAEGLTIYGVFGKSGKLVRALNKKSEPLPRGQSVSFVAFLGEETEESCEPWRVRFLGDCECGLLLSHTGSTVKSQVNLVCGKPESMDNFRVEMPTQVEEGGLIKCSFMSQPGTDVFIGPLPLALLLPGVDRREEKPWVVSNWIGIGRRQCCARTNFKTEFVTRAKRVGIMEFTGFKTYAGPDDDTGRQFSLLRLVTVTPKK
jgi:hypothetical protein